MCLLCRPSGPWSGSWRCSMQLSRRGASMASWAGMCLMTSTRQTSESAWLSLPPTSLRCHSLLCSAERISPGAASGSAPVAAFCNGWRTSVALLATCRTGLCATAAPVAVTACPMCCHMFHQEAAKQHTAVNAVTVAQPLRFGLTDQASCAGT